MHHDQHMVLVNANPILPCFAIDSWTRVFFSDLAFGIVYNTNYIKSNFKTKIAREPQVTASRRMLHDVEEVMLFFRSTHNAAN